MNQLNRKDTVSYLVYALSDILEPYLGEYNLVSGSQILGTVPSIQAAYPRDTTQLQKNMVPNSGVECIINPTPRTEQKLFKGGTNRQSCKYYQIILDQWDPKEGLIEAIEAITTSSKLDINEDVIIRQSKELDNNQGMYPERAILTHRQAHYKTGSYVF